MCTSLAQGFAHPLSFSISPIRKNELNVLKKLEDNEEYILTLAPFTKVPKIHFGEIKINKLVEKELKIFNPHDFDVTLDVKSDSFDKAQLFVQKLGTTKIKFKWQPITVESYKRSIHFEVADAPMLKFKVDLFGKSMPNQEKRKPLHAIKQINLNKRKVACDSFKRATDSLNSDDKENEANSNEYVIKDKLKSTETKSEHLVEKKCFKPSNMCNLSKAISKSPDSGNKSKNFVSKYNQSQLAKYLTSNNEVKKPFLKRYSNNTSSNSKKTTSSKDIYQSKKLSFNQESLRLVIGNSPQSLSSSANVKNEANMNPVVQSNQTSNAGMSQNQQLILDSENQKIKNEILDSKKNFL